MHFMRLDKRICSIWMGKMHISHKLNSIIKFSFLTSLKLMMNFKRKNDDIFSVLGANSESRCCWGDNSDHEVSVMIQLQK